MIMNRLVISILAYSVTFLSTTYALNLIKDYYMQHGIGGDCGASIYVTDDAYLRSHVGAFQIGNMIPYGNDQDCSISLDAGTGRKLFIQFIEFNLQPAQSGQCLDKLEIYDSEIPQTTTPATTSVNIVTTEIPTTSGNDVTDNSTVGTTVGVTASSNVTMTSPGIESTTNSSVTTDSSTVSSNSGVTSSPPSGNLRGTYCGNSAQVYTSEGRNITVKFTTDGSVTANGFKLLVTSFSEDSICTSSDEFRCDTNRCINNILKCDTINHCQDHSDESQTAADCTWLDDVIGTMTALGTNVLLVIIILASVIVLVPVSSIIIYHVFCKKKTEENANDSESNLVDRSQSSKKAIPPKHLPKNVVAVQPAEHKTSKPNPDDDAW